MSENNGNLKLPSTGYLITLIVIVLILWILLGIVPFLYFNNSFSLEGQSISKWGSLGDTFGMVNALFSGLAFAAIIFTLRQQQIDLKITKEDFKNSIKAQEDAAKQLGIQNELVKERMKLDVEILEIETIREIDLVMKGAGSNTILQNGKDAILAKINALRIKLKMEE